MVEVSIIPLKCPECGAELVGLDQDVIFFCQNCLRAYEFDDKRFKQVTVLQLPKPEGVGTTSLLWLPIWVFKASAKASTPPGCANQVNRILSAHQWIWVMSFRGFRSSYFGDPGLLYTSRAIEPNLSPPQQGCLPVGCSIRESEAKEYIAPFLLSLIDRSVDVAGIEVFPEISESRLVSVPFIDEDDKIKDIILDYKWPIIFLEDIVPLRSISKRIGIT